MQQKNAIIFIFFQRADGLCKHLICNAMERIASGNPAAESARAEK